MENVTLSDLVRDEYGAEDFEPGERVRLYITYWNNPCNEIYIKEGVVIDPSFIKANKKLVSPAVKMKVEISGRIVNGRPVISKADYTGSYSYPSIGLVERLSQ